MNSDFSYIRYWLFDLDNTFYPAHSDIFRQIEKRFTLYIQQKFNLSHENAYIKQKEYYHQYGTTLNGLMKCDNVNPDEFLEFVHTIDLTNFKVDNEFNERIAVLPGKKYIVTNASKRHAQNILKHMKIWDHIDAIFDIYDANFIPKPHAEYYHTFMTQYKILTHQTAMFEDMLVNLTVPFHMGMKTIYVKPNSISDTRPENVHYTCDTLKDFLLSIEL